MKIRITFVIPANIEFNGGIEKTIKKYIEYNNGKFDVNLLEGKYDNKSHEYNNIVIKSIYCKYILKTSGPLNFLIRIMSPLLLKIFFIFNIIFFASSRLSPIPGITKSVIQK